MKKKTGYYIKGLTKDGGICFYDGCQNPYSISKNWMPKGFRYDDYTDAYNMMTHLNPNPITGAGNGTGIEWEVVEERIFIKLKVEWCKDYIKDNDNL